MISLLTTAHSAFRTKPLRNTVTLTFDDGPNPRDTPRILAILKHYKIHAVFFVTARLAKIYPYLIRRIAAGGHVVANHTITHPMLTRMSNRRVKYEILGSNRIIKNILGRSPVCIRPPFLATNRRIRRLIRSYGMLEIMGAGTSDYRRMGRKRLVRRVLRQVHPGIIIIFHDGPAKRAQTVAALPGVIEGIKRMGLGFSLICNR